MSIIFTNPSSLSREELEESYNTLLESSYLAQQLIEAQELAAVRLHLLQYNIGLIVVILKLHKSGDRAELDKMLDKNLAAYEKNIGEIEAEKKGSVH
jgi:hypothetical protein